MFQPQPRQTNLNGRSGIPCHLTLLRQWYCVANEKEQIRGRAGVPITEPLLWVALGALAVQAALFYAKELQPVHFWVLTLFNWACLFALPYAIHTAYL